MLKVAVLLLLATPAAAEQAFDVFLGGHQLGWLRYSGTEGRAELTSLFDRTPLGVFDGTYEGASTGRDYRGISQSSNKTRTVEIRQHQGRVTEVAITPEKDRTDLSTPAAVPAWVLDPVAGFGRLIAQSRCPDAFRLYDGRRVITVSPGKTSTTAGVTTCDMAYQVTQGRGHLSPLYVRNISIKMVFDPAIAATGPSLITLRSGIFAVEFRRN
jgi:hypothetical protein